MSRTIKQLSALVASALLAACGGSSNSYTVGGSLAGLAAGNIITLFNHGGDPLIRTSNGTFVFTNTVEAAYSVTTGANPPWQRCAVANGSGTATANVENISVICANSNAVVTTLAGSITSGSSDGSGAGASFNGPYGITVDASGNIYVADINNHMIRKITAAGVVTTLAGSTTPGSADGTGASASFNQPYGVAPDASGNLYVADRANHMIRKVTAAGVVTTLAGSTTPGSSDGTGTGASFNAPNAVALDGNGNVYVADRGNNMIRKITPEGVVTTLAGSTTPGSSDGTGTGASFDRPNGVALDTNNNVYVGSFGNPMIRKITPAGVVTTVAGSTTAGASDGTGPGASFNAPAGVAVDAHGHVYVADRDNHMIRKITPAGVVTTLAGSTTSGFSDGTGSGATFTNPTGLALDANGTIYVADRNNNMIRKMTPAP